MSSSNKLVFSALFVLLAFCAILDYTTGCGFPMPPAPPPMPCCAAPPPPPPPCGCGRRKKRGTDGELIKREAIVPVFKTEETPCPQLQWKELIDAKLVASDAATSVNDIQAALYNRYPNEKFLVACSLAGEEANNELNVLPNKVSLSSRGDGYCNVVKSRIWCQVVALSG